MSDNLTPVRVRAQAWGGKYIGPAVAKQYRPILSILVDGKPIHDDVTIPNMASGKVVPPEPVSTTSEISPYKIHVVQPPMEPNPYYPTLGTYFLLPPSDALPDDLAFVIVRLPLVAPTQVEFRVQAFAPQPGYHSKTVPLLPGGQYTSQPGVIVPVTGLYVPLFTATQPDTSGVVNFDAKVQMMCGCPITKQPTDAPPSPPAEPYWPSTEFEVVAYIQNASYPPITLTCVDTSQFQASAKLAPGSYDVWLSANQPSTGNAGSALTTIVVR
jgi:hypothetical protein